MSAIPTASSITMNKASDASVVHETLTVEQITASMKGTDILDIVKILKATVLELEKKVKAQKALKPVKEKKQKKAGSMPKGVVPKQLRMPRAWVEFVLKHANENGWEPFIISQTKKNKETGEKETEEIEMSGSVFHEGLYVFEDSITEACPTGKKAIHKDAMSLSKQYWTCKSQSGTRPDLYEAFEAEYVDEVEAEAEAEEEADADVEEDEQVEEVEPVQAPVKAGKKVDQKEQKALEAAEKKARDAAEKKEKKDQEAAEKKAKKDQEAAEKKAKKEQEEAEKKAKIMSKAVKAVKVEKPVEEEVKEEVKEEVTPIKMKPTKDEPKAPVKAKKVVKKEKEVEWTCPNDGNVYPWTFDGKSYLRTFEGCVWNALSENEIGLWAGQYDIKTGSIDESIPEPLYDEI